jgi:hypothetical protein
VTQRFHTITWLIAINVTILFSHYSAARKISEKETISSFVCTLKKSILHNCKRWYSKSKSYYNHDYMPSAFAYGASPKNCHRISPPSYHCGISNNQAFLCYILLFCSHGMSYINQWLKQVFNYCNAFTVESIVHWVSLTCRHQCVTRVEQRDGRMGKKGSGLRHAQEKVWNRFNRVYEMLFPDADRDLYSCF